MANSARIDHLMSDAKREEDSQYKVLGSSYQGLFFILPKMILLMLVVSLLMIPGAVLFYNAYPLTFPEQTPFSKTTIANV